ncbi:hypothetical protein NDU88_000819 [Pleurodeles waltl]|uniref:Uncharacterized protein n=1 Tax=Pleurodeles waltl TaxID=8319 RepID=A0AAV7V7S3_PLEWA|nr:hypothetical protein NDU88_000819 [Pleurodeles waltl]
MHPRSGCQPAVLSLLLHSVGPILAPGVPGHLLSGERRALHISLGVPPCSHRAETLGWVGTGAFFIAGMHGLPPYTRLMSDSNVRSEGQATASDAPRSLTQTLEAGPYGGWALGSAPWSEE